MILVQLFCAQNLNFTDHSCDCSQKPHKVPNCSHVTLALKIHEEERFYLLSLDDCVLIMTFIKF